ncbi:MAG: hypothetical protein Q4C17_07405, partial [Bacillota bacterium]|nr:hypothetical protein [Bacillota bacterium]
LSQNLISSARYRLFTVYRLKPSSDVTLHALQMVKILSDGYGLTKDAAMWSVISWCQMLKLGEIADVIQNMFPAGQAAPTAPSLPQPNMTTKLTLGHGMYLAGVDFAAGDIKLEAARKNNKQEIYYAIIKKGSNSIAINGFFKTQTYLTIADGQRLEVRDNVLLSNL